MSKLVFKSDLFQCDRIVVKKLVFYNRSVETANHIAGELPSGYEHDLYIVTNTSTSILNIQGRRLYRNIPQVNDCNVHVERSNKILFKTPRFNTIIY